MVRVKPAQISKDQHSGEQHRRPYSVKPVFYTILLIAAQPAPADKAMQKLAGPKKRHGNCTYDRRGNTVPDDFRSGQRQESVTCRQQKQKTQ